MFSNKINKFNVMSSIFHLYILTENILVISFSLDNYLTGKIAGI